MSVVEAGRRFHERAVLIDECTITRQGETTFNPSTGTYETEVTVVGSGLACHMTPFTGARTLDEEFGGEIVVTRNYALKLEWDAPTVQREDTVLMTSSQDPGLVGRTFRVDQVDAESRQMSRKIICEAIGYAPSEESS